MLLSHCPVPFNVPGGSVRLRDDVGIVPYNCDGTHTVQRTGAVPWDFGTGVRSIQFALFLL